MILSEFESLKDELPWQTESRLAVLSSSGRPTNGHAPGNQKQFFGAGPKKAVRSNSLLNPEIEMSHSEAYNNGYNGGSSAPV